VLAEHEFPNCFRNRHLRHTNIALVAQAPL
jgi:hypothetical protein